MNKIKNILLIINYEKNIPSTFLDNLSAIFDKNSVSVYIFNEAIEYVESSGSSLKYSVIKEDSDLCFMDISIVLGGDGTILRAAIQLCEFEIPILGINFGTLGYMAELEASDVELVHNVISGSFFIESRMMLSSSVRHANGKTEVMPPSLNDIVLSNGPIARLLNFNVSYNGVLIEKCRADGMIIATPTGSTAYSMSAGGPIMSPVLNAICLTPICPHSFSNRPMILSAESYVELTDIETKDNSVYISLDGRLAKKLERNDTVIISRSDSCAKLIRLKPNSFLSVLSKKLQDV